MLQIEPLDGAGGNWFAAKKRKASAVAEKLSFLFRGLIRSQGRKRFVMTVAYDSKTVIKLSEATDP
jgi:hypothetical protein